MPPEQNQSPVPCLPESAPFTPEQRAYLNGFFAGLFSRGTVKSGFLPGAAPAETLTPISILFGSQTGNAENLAKRVAREAGKRGYAPTVHDLSEFPVAQLPVEERLLLITSTYGDGEPPDNVRAFWSDLNQAEVPSLSRTRFAVCALGDSNYPKFCQFGKDLDQRLESLGAKRAHQRVDCDVDFEEPFSQWFNEALVKIGSVSALDSGAPASNAILTVESVPRKSADGHPPQCSRANPFPASLTVNRLLNGPGSQKETRHFEIAFDESKAVYETGDALGVFPENCEHLVNDLLSVLRLTGSETVKGRDDAEVSLRDALLRHYEITRIPSSLLKTLAEKTASALLRKLTSPGVNGELTAFLWGREIIDLLHAHPEVAWPASEFVALLKKLPPRLYSIASSPKVHPRHAHLTVNVVRYESLGRKRMGVCSSFLAERLQSGRTVPVFVQKSPHFRPPRSGDVPMIMVGPGTGVAPFRAFLQERRSLGATGKNWLFFGDQHSQCDFLYRDEFEKMVQEGSLHRLSLAFSRDQREKLYVQHRMIEHGKELFSWLERGAHFYVCGDAKKMAKDVDKALHEIVQTHAAGTPDQAAEYVNRLKTDQRYQRDVY